MECTTLSMPVLPERYDVVTVRPSSEFVYVYLKQRLFVRTYPQYHKLLVLLLGKMQHIRYVTIRYSEM